MKTTLKKFMVLFAAFLILSGCRLPFEPPQTKKSPAEKGSFSLAIDGIRDGRTIIPEIQNSALVAYSLAFFTGTIDDSAVIVNRTTGNLSDPVMLDEGTWNLLVTAYLDTERTKPAAQGSLSGIVIASGEETTDSVTLSQITAAGSGQGTFSWEIDYPNDVTGASMAITRLNGNTETLVDTWFFEGGTDPTKTVGKEASLPLPAGYYRVVFTLTNNVNKSVGWPEILHIYEGMDSAFSQEFTSDQFLYVLYTVTFASNGGSPVPGQSVYLNTTVARPANPTRSGQNFTGWYNDYYLNTLYDFNNPVTGNITLYAGWHVAGEEGIYVGIIKFANTAVDIITPRLLDAAGKTALTNALTNDYTIAPNIGTTMFYGVHKALANLTANEFSYPTNLDSVNIITFTDGLDNQSAGVSRQSNMAIENKTFQTIPNYAQYVSGEIENRTIAGIDVTAYSISVPGTDLDQTNPEILDQFENYLGQIASPGNYYPLTDFDQVREVFDEIARRLTITRRTAAFTILTNLVDDGTRLRMTFDVGSTTSSAAAASQRYIEGTVNESGGAYTFTNITYGGGIASDAGYGPLAGTVISGNVNFTFNNITILDPETGEPIAYVPEGSMQDLIRPRQWTINLGYSNWVHNSEYNSTGAGNSEVEKRSAVIYLVLDNSTSLGVNDIAQIRTAANEFIDSVYTKYYSDILSPRQVTIAMWDSNSDGWDNSAALRISVNGISRTTNARLASGYGPGYYNFEVNMSDVVTFYWVNGGQYDKECAFAVYYSEDPPNPMFNPSSGTTGGKVLVSKRYNNPSGAVGSGTNMGSFTVH